MENFDNLSAPDERALFRWALDSAQVSMDANRFDQCRSFVKMAAEQISIIKRAKNLPLEGKLGDLVSALVSQGANPERARSVALNLPDADFNQMFTEALRRCK